MPCPGGVDIPGVFAAWNNMSLYGTDPKQDWNMQQIRAHDAGADRCLACGACQRACPQHLPIIDSLQAAWSEMGMRD